MPDNKSTPLAPLVRALVAATGMTRFGVYKALREGRTPRNPLVAKAWSKVLVAPSRGGVSCQHRSKPAGRKVGAK